MPQIPDSFLEELRARLPVSDVVRRRLPALKREGSEWKVLSPFNKEKTPSFTVNDHKAIWFDHSAGKGGNIFNFEMEMTGCTFMQAVENLAALAGLPVPGAHGKVNGQAGAVKAAKGREITATYDYLDREGQLLYQVCRFEWFYEGKRKKAFGQRRHVSGDQGGWVWGLGADTYVRGDSGDWFRLTKERSSWKGDRLIATEAVPHSLYRWPELYLAMGAARSLVFSPEGEKDCETLAAWGLVATDSSGGSTNWSPHHAEELRGADVVIVADNDKPGREYAHAKAASLRGIAAHIRVLDWREHWADAPDGADVTDWRDHGFGNLEKLNGIVAHLPAWAPKPPDSHFNAIRFSDLDKPAREFEWLIKGVLTRGEVSLVYGQPSAGKSFVVTDFALAIARGISWMGLRTRQGLVCYQAGEGGLGLKLRLRAYRQARSIPRDEEIPFVLLPSPVDLYEGDADVEKLIAEIKAWASFYDTPLELVVIDTLASATPGANENASDDVSRVLARCRRIARECSSHVCLVHHTTKGGETPRGHSSLTGNVESAIGISYVDDGDDRQMVVSKQKDGPGGLTRRFKLETVQMGVDIDGDAVTSCVVGELAPAHRVVTPHNVPKGWVELKGNNLLFMRCLVKAIAKHGKRPPDDIKCPDGISAVTVGEWQDELEAATYAGDVDDPDRTRLKGRVKKAIERTYTAYRWNDRGSLNLIVKEREWVWRSGRKVMGIDQVPANHTPMATAIPEGVSGLIDEI